MKLDQRGVKFRLEKGGMAWNMGGFGMGKDFNLPMLLIKKVAVWPALGILPMLAGCGMNMDHGSMNPPSSVPIAAITFT